MFLFKAKPKDPFLKKYCNPKKIQGLELQQIKTYGRQILEVILLYLLWIFLFGCGFFLVCFLFRPVVFWFLGVFRPTGLTRRSRQTFEDASFISAADLAAGN